MAASKDYSVSFKEGIRRQTLEQSLEDMEGVYNILKDNRKYLIDLEERNKSPLRVKPPFVKAERE